MTRVQTQITCRSRFGDDLDCSFMGFLDGMHTSIEHCPICGSRDIEINPVSDDPDVLDRMRDHFRRAGR